MTVTRQTQTVVDIVYPEEDGKPMGETGWHVEAIMDLFTMLKDRYTDRPDVQVCADLFVYYEEGNPRAVICPDVFVAFGVRAGKRRTYRLWEEGCPPTVAFEVSSRSTRREDFGLKKVTCALLGVAEYFVYDPLGEYLKPPLQGFRLAGNAYEHIEPNDAGAVESRRLGLMLSVRDGELCVVDTRTGERLRGMAAQREARLAERQLRREAEARLVAERRVRLAEEEARAQADALLDAERQARLAEEEARVQAEARATQEREARREAETEVKRLRAELARRRGTADE
jgi:Uma2 family endonuclease